jgi:hypothetical protein
MPSAVFGELDIVPPFLMDRQTDRPPFAGYLTLYDGCLRAAYYNLHRDPDSDGPISLSAPILTGIHRRRETRSWSRALSRHLYRRIFDDQAIHMVVMKKITEDRRGWNWHDEAF